MPDGQPWPLVTIVTPSFNQGAFIEETIRSVLLQGYPSLEYIIMDGGSTDGTLAILEKYAGRLTWVSEKDRGQSDAIIKGFARAQGTYLAWINSDDYYLPGALAHLVGTLVRKGGHFVCGDVMRRHGTEPPQSWNGTSRASYRDMLRTLFIPIPQPATLWTRMLWQQTGGLDPKWHCVLDRDFFIRAGLEFDLLYEPGVVAVCRVHADAKSTALLGGWLTEMPALYRQFFARGNLPSEIAALKRETLFNVWLYCARVAAQCRRNRLPYWLAAFRCDPRRSLQNLRAGFDRMRETSSARPWRIVRWLHQRRGSAWLGARAEKAAADGRPGVARVFALWFLCCPPHHGAVSKKRMFRLMLRGA